MDIMKKIKMCGWITFAEKIICIVLIISIFSIACSCMSFGQSCMVNSIDGMEAVDKESVTAGYEVLGGMGVACAGGLTYMSAFIIFIGMLIPFMAYVITTILNITGLVRLRQLKTRAISASAIASIIVDVIMLTLYMVMFAGDTGTVLWIVITAIVTIMNIADIIINGIILDSVSKLKKLHV